jgi:putative DNA primase/helicase
VSTTFLDAALALAKLGFAVFPVVPGSKKPLIEEWQHRATTNLLDIIHWWNAQCPNANIGIATGAKSGVTVLDVDEKASKNGGATLLGFIAKFGEFPNTLMQRTPSGGAHYFFKYVPGVANSVEKLGSGLDIRGEGGYVVAAPSVLTGEESGAYKWEDLLLVELEMLRIAEMPQWMRDKLVKPAGHFVEIKSTRRTSKEWAEKMHGVPKGSRQDELVRVVGKLIRNNEAELARTLAHQYGHGCEPPLTETEVDACFDRIIAKEQAKGRRDPDDAGGERYTDMANAALLAAEAEGQIAHADEMGHYWLIYDGTRLKEEPKHAIVPFVTAVAQRLYREAKAVVSKEQRKLKLKGAARLESRDGCHAAIDLAQAQPALRIKMAVLDQHPTWLNTPSGTLDLATGERHAHRFEDFITRVTTAPYDPAATCPQWDKFLEEVLPDPEVRSFMQRSMGYALTDSMHEQCLWLLHGSGRNGKSTFLNVIRRVLGCYAASTHASTLMVKKHGDDKRNDLAALRGSRLVTVSEAEVGHQLAEALLKQLTGGDPLTARKLYAEFFTFQPTFKIYIACNSLPQVHGQDLAIWRRIHLVPFTVTVPLDRVDPDLVSKLVDEGAGILRWAVEGYAAWRQGGLQPPEAVRAATAAYKREADPLADFLEMHTVPGPALQSTAAELFTAYQGWAARTGTRFPMNQKMLGQALEERGYKPVKLAGARGWQGLSVRPYVPS